MPRAITDLAAMLELAVDAWPALVMTEIDGWLVRTSGGGSKRANSVSARNFRGTDLDAAVDWAERCYQLRGDVARFQLEDDSEPAGLAARLKGRGYVVEEATTTMVKAVGGKAVGGAASDPQGLTPSPSGAVTTTDRATPDWLAVYLSAITANRRAVNARILDNVPSPRAFFLWHRNGKPTSSGLCVARGSFAIVECMATVADVRRSGGARAILAAIEAWAAQQGATTLFLQAVADNAPAIALYESAGYVHRATTRYMVKG